MLKLLSCSRGHFWEEEHADEAADEPAANGVATAVRSRCPSCGEPAEGLPLLDLVAAEPPPDGPVVLEPAPLRDRDGRPHLAGYDILEPLGKTPTGVYRYKARQRLVGRTVLLKVVFAQEDAGQRGWGHLRGEATALGKITHPGVVAVLEAGERDRQLFYNALEWVEGTTLAERAAKKPLTRAQAVHVVETVARVLHAAHLKGVVHRNLKPACVLLAGPAQTPVEACAVKVTDFGLAGRPAEGDVNDLDLMRGAAGLLSPEQVWGRAKDIGPATDVYLLGALLFELLTGQPPFLGRGVSDTISLIQVNEAPPPSAKKSGVGRDLDAVVQKCLRKSPRRRYANALEVAEELGRVRQGVPVKARPVGGLTSLVRLVRRRPMPFVLVALLFVTAFAVMTAFLRGNDRPPTNYSGRLYVPENQRVASLEAALREAQDREKVSAYLRLIARAESAVRSDDRLQARRLLDRCPAEQRQWEWYYLDMRAGGADEHPLPVGENKGVTGLAYSPSGNHLAVAVTGKPQGEVQIWNGSLGGRVNTITPGGAVHAVAFNPAGDQLVTVTAPAGAVVVRRGSENEIKGWDVGARQPNFVMGCSWAHGLAVAPDFTFVVGLDNGKVCSYRMTGGPNQAREPAPVGRPTTLRLAYNADQTRLACLDEGNARVTVYDRTGTLAQQWLQGVGVVSAPTAGAFGVNDQLAVGYQNGAVCVWDRQTVAPPLDDRHPAAVVGVAFTADGRRLIAVGEDGTVRVWETQGWTPVLRVPGGNRVPKVEHAALSPDGRRLVINSGGKVLVLGARPGPW